MTQFPDPVEADRRLSAQMRFWLGVVGLVLFVVSTPLQLIYGDGLPWSGVILLPLSIGFIYQGRRRLQALKQEDPKD